MRWSKSHAVRRAAAMMLRYPVLSDRIDGPVEPDWLDSARRRATICLARAEPGIGIRCGIIRSVLDLTIEADDPRLYHAATSMANTEPLFGRMSFRGNGGAGLTRELATASAIG